MPRYLKFAIGLGTAVGLIGGTAATLYGVRIHRVGGVSTWRTRSLMHFCLWDSDCRAHGNPPRIYAFGWVVDFPDRQPEGAIFDVFDDDGHRDK